MSGVKRLQEVWEAYHADTESNRCSDEPGCVEFYNNNCLCSDTDCCIPIKNCYFENLDNK
tara:strand:- start:2038 stop:2217 length:180 start_codon:yes stop_codon:yes gene_type:complete